MTSKVKKRRAKAICITILKLVNPKMGGTNKVCFSSVLYGWQGIGVSVQ
jgi:hypothetical protein